MVRARAHVPYRVGKSHGDGGGGACVDAETVRGPERTTVRANRTRARARAPFFGVSSHRRGLGCLCTRPVGRERGRMMESEENGVADGVATHSAHAEQWKQTIARASKAVVVIKVRSLRSVWRQMARRSGEAARRTSFRHSTLSPAASLASHAPLPLRRQTVATRAFDTGAAPPRAERSSPRLTTPTRTEVASSGYATGFVVDTERGLILTNRHVMKVRGSGRDASSRETDPPPARSPARPPQRPSSAAGRRWR